MATKHVGGPGNPEEPARTSAKPGVTRTRVSVKAHSRAPKAGASSVKYKAHVTKNSVSINPAPGTRKLNNADGKRRGQ